jgi:hypothetical protein
MRLPWWTAAQFADRVIEVGPRRELAEHLHPLAELGTHARELRRRETERRRDVLVDQPHRGAKPLDDVEAAQEALAPPQEVAVLEAIIVDADGVKESPAKKSASPLSCSARRPPWYRVCPGKSKKVNWNSCQRRRAPSGCGLPAVTAAVVRHGSRNQDGEAITSAIRAV